MIGKDNIIEVPSIGGRKTRVLSRQILGDILEPRVEEIFELVHREIERMKLTELLASGVVLTGGTTLLPGMVEVAEDVIGLPVRQGIPQSVGGLVDIVKSPMYATGVGLVLYGAQQADQRYFRARDENIYSKVKKRMGAWLHEVL
jgi:cell division protein FtsA